MNERKKNLLSWGLAFAIPGAIAVVLHLHFSTAAEDPEYSTAYRIKKVEEALDQLEAARKDQLEAQLAWQRATGGMTSQEIEALKHQQEQAIRAIEERRRDLEHRQQVRGILMKPARRIDI